MPPSVLSRSPRPVPIILVADDDRDTRELYRACFDTTGYQTAEAETGSQAIVTAVELVPDILLIDYVLPDVNGLTVAARLKRDPRTAGIHVLLVTGYGTAAVTARAAAVGIERVLLKPCLPDTVMREVRRALHRQTAAPAPFEAAATRAAAIARVRSEFGGLPGLALTAEQARLVFGLPRETAEGILQGLVAEGFLARTRNGSFTRPL
jgi:two-component system, cell cycle response regulator DivK